MTDRGLTALAAALDFSKQQIAFAGILISVTFAFFPQYFTKPVVSTTIFATTFASWGCLFLSVVLGLIILGQSASRLETEEPGRILANKWIRACAQCQMVALALGVLLMFLSVSSISWKSTTASPASPRTAVGVGATFLVSDGV